MSHPIRVAVLVGSLRDGSTHRRIAERLRDDAAEGVQLDIVEGLAEIPFYNEDLDVDPVPQSAAGLRESVTSADAVLIVTPEFNATMPAVVNNAIDWLSRPYGAGAIVGKPVAVVGSSPTPYGAKWAHEHALTSVGIAGGQAVADATVSQSLIDLDLFSDAEAWLRFRAALDALVGEARALQPA